MVEQPSHSIYGLPDMRWVPTVISASSND